MRGCGRWFLGQAEGGGGSGSNAEEGREGREGGGGPLALDGLSLLELVRNWYEAALLLFLDQGDFLQNVRVDTVRAVAILGIVVQQRGRRAATPWPCGRWRWRQVQQLQLGIANGSRCRTGDRCIAETPTLPAGCPTGWTTTSWRPAPPPSRAPSALSSARRRVEAAAMVASFSFLPPETTALTFRTVAFKVFAACAILARDSSGPGEDFAADIDQGGHRLSAAHPPTQHHC